MHEWLRIGNAVVFAENSDILPENLGGLRRLRHSAPVTGEADAVLTVMAADRIFWAMDVTEEGGMHRFGRPHYAIEVIPDKKHITLRIAAPLNAEDLYWIQRDIFGLLACMAGEIMLHGSAVIGPDGKGWVFCGASGAGKSTLCRMLIEEGLTPVNDEINWLFYENADTLSLVNQPYWFGLDERPAIPVARIFLLKQGPSCAILPGPPRSEAFARLLASYLSVDMKHNFLQARAMALKSLVENHAVDILEFNLNAREIYRFLWEKGREN